jgi:fumarate reductase subunit C
VVTWFEILPKTMPKLILRGRQLPQRQVTAMGPLVALVCSAALLVVVVAIGAIS